jgi:hypothetical protein
MQINTDFSTDSVLANLQRQRSGTGATSTQTSSSAPNDAAAGQTDSTLQRLNDVPASVQDADWEIQDEAGAAQALESARQGMLRQPGTALAAQANQSYQNVLNLLQPAD